MPVKTNKRQLIHIFIWFCCTFVFGKALNAQQNLNLSKQTVYLDKSGDTIDFNTFLKWTNGTNFEFIPLNVVNDTAFMVQIVISNEELQRIENSNQKTEVVEVKTPISSTKTTFKSIGNTKDLEGGQMPYFEIKDLKGNIYNSVNMAGKTVVLKFWYTSCAPCIQEMPELNQLEATYDHLGVVFLAPSVDRDKGRILSFLNKHTFNYTVIPDGQPLADLLQVSGYPTHVVIDGNGRITKVVTGVNSQIKRVLQKSIELAMYVNPDDYYVNELDPYEQIPLDGSAILEKVDGTPITVGEYEVMVSRHGYIPMKRVKTDGSIHYFIVKKSY